MKKILIYCFIISPFFVFAQTDSIQIETKKDNAPKQGIFVGVDLFNPAISLFSDKKGGEAVIAFPFKKRLNLVAEVGFEKNIFINSIWDVEASGMYARAGANWFVSQDRLDPNMGYYLGGRIGYAPFKQTINLYTIQGTDVENIQGSVEEHNANTLWVEPTAGGRVGLFNSNFYVDASVKLKVKLWDSNDYDITPLIIPGFGTNENGLNFGVNWSVGYVF